MGEITSIEPQKRHKGRFNVYLDGKFTCGLSENTIVKEGLKVGQRLSLAEIENLLEKEQGSKAYDKALRFLSFRPRSEEEIRKKLTERGFDSLIIQKTIERLKEEDLINDEEFCRIWIRNRIALRPSGSYILRRELRQKGIAEATILKILKEFFKKNEEFKLAKKAAEKKKTTWKSLKKLEANQKMAAFLARRGFSWEIIKKVLKSLEGLN